jgi:hypothetical protein
LGDGPFASRVLVFSVSRRPSHPAGPPLRAYDDDDLADEGEEEIGTAEEAARVVPDRNGSHGGLSPIRSLPADQCHAMRSPRAEKRVAVRA